MSVFLTPYTTPANYTHVVTVEVVGGFAKLKQIMDIATLVAYWESNETTWNGTPDEVIDSSNNGLHGTAKNGAVTIAGGKLGRAGSYDGLDDYMTVADDPALNFGNTADFSIAWWVKTGINKSHRYLGKINAGATTGYYGFWDYIGFTNFYGAGEGVSPARATTNIKDDNWHMLIGIRDQDGVRLRIFVDNILENTVVIAPSSATTNGKFSIGRMGDLHDAAGYTQAKIDEVSVWSRALTSGDRDALWNAGAGKRIEGYDSTGPTIYKTAGNAGTIELWTNFVVTYGPGNQGSIALQLSEDGIVWKHWDGGAWVVATTEYNTPATVNTNLGAFPTASQEIYVKAFLISNGYQIVEVDSIQIGYVSNVAPSLDAGVNKAIFDGQINFSPFSDCTFSDPDGTVDHVFYKIDGEVDIWTEILIGGFGSLIEAARAFVYQFDNIGILTASLKVEDDGGVTTEDSLLVTVNAFSVNFIVRDSDGLNIQNLTFDPQDGTGAILVTSPFVALIGAAPQTVLFKKAGYSLIEFTFSTVTDNQTVSVVLYKAFSENDIIPLALALKQRMTSSVEVTISKPQIDVEIKKAKQVDVETMKGITSSVEVTISKPQIDVEIKKAKQVDVEILRSE